MAKKILTIKGLDKLEKKLRKSANMGAVKSTVNLNGKELREKMICNADFHGHQEWKKGVGMVDKPATGATKGSIKLKITDGGFTAEVGPTTEYAEYLELGTRFMEAQPFIKPAFDEQYVKFKSDMQKLVK